MSKPKPRRQPVVGGKSSAAGHIDLLDEALASCRTVGALAELLFRSEVELVSPKTVAVTGALILEETEKVRRCLNSFPRRNQP